MAPAFATALRCLVLALCLVTAGCAHLFGGAGRQGKETKVAATHRPPDPAPALFIPGPSVAAKPVSNPKDGERTTLPPLIPALVKNMPAEEAPKEPSPLRRLYDQAAQRFAQMPCYSVRLRRREMVGNQPKAEEVLDCKFRQEPYSVYFRWLGPEAKNREVTYVKGRFDNQIHTLTAAGDVFLMPAGKHFKIAPDSPLVRSKSRYPITEAALGTWIVRFGRLVEGSEKDNAAAGAAKYLGELKRPEFEEKVAAVSHKIAPGWEPLLPRGGQRLWFFDPGHHMPVLIITHDDAGREVEYYCLDQYRFTVPMTDDDFDPDRLWKR